MAVENNPEPGAANPTESRAKSRDLWELGVGYGLILLVIWTPRPWQRALYITAVVFLVIVIWKSFHSPQAMGLRLTNLLRSLWVVGIALTIAAISILIAIRLDTLHGVGGPVLFLKRYWGYALWSFAQQLLLQDFFLRRFRRLLPGGTSAAFAAAGIFSLAHLPNPILTAVTFSLGLAACFVFLRYRNLYVLAVAHAILGITIAITIPSPLIRNMRVGLGYLTYRSHRGHHDSHRNHSDHVVSTSAWVMADAPTLRS